MLFLRLQYSSLHMVALSILATAVAAVTPAAQAQNVQEIQKPQTPTTGNGNAPQAPTAARGSSVTHVIKQGDTLNSLCRQFKIEPTQCAQVTYFNQLNNSKLPAPGNTVYVPLSLLPGKPQQARLVQTAGDVHINGKSANAGAWLDERARITAQENSSAVVELADGSRVKVLPASVADIVHSRSYTTPDASGGNKVVQWIGSKIRLVQGAVESTAKKRSAAHADAPKPVEVETVTSLIGVRGTQFRVAAADAFVPHDRAEVLEGSVSNINTWKHSEIILHAGQGAIVDPNSSTMQAQALLPAPAVPQQIQVLRRPDPHWSFNPVPGAVAYRVMAARDADFDTIEFSEKTNLPQADLSRLPDGIWHVRARAVNAQGLEGFDAASIIDLRPPAWVLRNASVQNIRGRMHLLWTDIATANFQPLPGTTTVALDIAREQNFAAPPLAQLQTTGNAIELPRLGHGRYYLRMVVNNDTLKNKEPQTFALDLPAHTQHLAYNLLLQNVPQ